jgi:pilus assembly protein TadC
MKVRYRVYTTLARFVPGGYRKYLEKMLVYAGEKRSVNFWIGSSSILAFLVFIIAVLSGSIFLPAQQAVIGDVVPLGFPFMYVILALAVFMAVQFFVYVVIYFKVVDRTKRVEESLPDALQLMSANLRAGMTPFQAMKLAARKEFGPLKEEIEYATAKALGTESFAGALLGMARRVKSPLLDRTMKLFTTSMKSGGHLAQLLEDLANDIAETRTLKKEFITNTRMYSMLIIFMVTIGAPLLFAVSIHFVKIISGMQAEAGTAQAGFELSFLAGELVLSPEFLVVLAVITIIITAVLASMLMGVIAEGKSKYGLKYAPFVVTGALLAFAAAQYLIGALLQS